MGAVQLLRDASVPHPLHDRADLGLVADRFLGAYRSVLWGGIIIALGHLTLAFESLAMFYAGLALIVIGTGLLKPSATTLVGSLCDRKDARRDAGFSIFYMGINLGAFLGPRSNRERGRSPSRRPPGGVRLHSPRMGSAWRRSSCSSCSRRAAGAAS